MFINSVTVRLLHVRTVGKGRLRGEEGAAGEAQRCWWTGQESTCLPQEGLVAGEALLSCEEE